MITDTEQRRYYQFPISALQLGSSIDAVTNDAKETAFQRMITYCLVDAMETVNSQFDEEAIDEMAAGYLDTHRHLSKALTKDDKLMLAV